MYENTAKRKLFFTKAKDQKQTREWSDQTGPLNKTQGPADEVVLGTASFSPSGSGLIHFEDTMYSICDVTIFVICNLRHSGSITKAAEKFLMD